MATNNGIARYDNGRVTLYDNFARPLVIAADPMRQATFSGTPSMQGVSRPDDYQVEMSDPVLRMAAFEEMRASDDAVEAAVSAREQMVTAGNWQLTAPSDNPANREILEFCEDNIYPVIDDMLRWLAGGMLQYGFGLIEPVYAWSDELPRRGYVRQGKNMAVRKYGRRIVLSKLQHVKQRTIWTFRLDVAGNLLAVSQYVYNGAAFVRIDVAPEKLLLATYNRQGDDYWGIPPTRHVYKAYTFKNQLERLNILGVDRFGVGTPVAEGGVGWVDKDFERLEKYMSTWRAGAETYLIHPAGGKIDIKGANGTMTVAVLDFIKYYNLAIAKTFLTQGSELGSTETGARALGEVMLEQSETIVQSDCEALANLINEKLVVPLVRLNFGEQEDYPRFVPSQRVRASSAIGTVIQQLVVAKAISWRPEDERWLRDVMHLPEVSLDELKKLAAERQAQAAAISGAIGGAQPSGDATATPKGAAPDAPPADPTKMPQGRAGEPPAKKQMTGGKASKQLAVFDDGAEGYDKMAMPADFQTMMGGKYRTLQYSEWEQGVLKPNVLARDLDLQAARLAGEVLAALASIDMTLAEQVAGMAANGVDALTAGIRKIAVPERAKAKLRRIISDATDRARAYGMSSVSNELARQDGAAVAVNAPSVDAGNYTPTLTTQDERDADAVRRNAALRAEVDRAVEAETNRREEAVRAGALLAIHSAGALTVAELARLASSKVQNALEDLSTNRTVDNVGSVINAGFGTGRRDGADVIMSEDPNRIVAKVYSAVMDGGTCDECAKWDGARFPVDYPEDATGVQAPNPRCQGTFKRCRCVWVYVTNEETPSAVPSSRGVI